MRWHGDIRSPSHEEPGGRECSSEVDFADLSRARGATKDLIKKGLVMDEQCEAVLELVRQGASVKSGCQVVGLSRSTTYREPADWRLRDAAVIAAIQ